MRISLVDIGWFCFFLSGLFFLSDAIDSGDKTALGSAITWLVGIGVFIAASRMDQDGSGF